MTRLIILICLLICSVPVSAQLPTADSLKIPVWESYDTTCQCFREYVTMYMVWDTTTADTSLLIGAGFRRFGNLLWDTKIIAADSAGTISLRAVVIDYAVPGDINGDGRLSIGDIQRMIHILFIHVGGP